MNTSAYTCSYDSPSEVYWVRPVDIGIGVVFMLISIATLFINAFVIYSFIMSNRKLQGTSLILLQVAFNDFISGIVGIVFCSNLLADRNLATFAGSKLGDIVLCQMYAILLDIIYIAAPLLLAIATSLRVFAVLSPYNYQKINNQFKVIPIVLSVISWIWGAGVGLFPFFFKKWMCFSQISGSCDYFIINLLDGDKELTRIYSLLLFVVPGNVAYIVIVLGGIVVIGMLFKQNRKNVKRTTNRMEEKPLKVKVKNKNSWFKLTVANARAAFNSKSSSRRASESELKMMQKELSVIKCTLTLCATYFVAHFVTVAYNVVYMFKTDNNVFKTMSGNSNVGEVYLFAWFYLSHCLAGFVDGLVQIQCNNEMRKGIERFTTRLTSKASDVDFKASIFSSVNRLTTFHSINHPDHQHSERVSSKKKLGSVQSLPTVLENRTENFDNKKKNSGLSESGIEVSEKETSSSSPGSGKGNVLKNGRRNTEVSV